MTLLFVAALILIGCMLLCLTRDDFYDEDNFAQSLKNFAIMIMIIISIVIICYSATKPMAMDVYQGKTTLEITYKDGVPVDSVVVWKGGEK